MSCISHHLGGSRSWTLVGCLGELGGGGTTSNVSLGSFVASRSYLVANAFLCLRKKNIKTRVQQRLKMFGVGVPSKYLTSTTPGSS